MLTFPWIINNWFLWLYWENNLLEEFYLLFYFITLLDILFWYSKSCQSKWAIIGKVVLILPVDISKTYCFWFLWIGNFVFHKYIMNSVFFPHEWKGAFESIKYSYKDANLFCLYLFSQHIWNVLKLIFLFTCNKVCHQHNVDKIHNWPTLYITSLQPQPRHQKSL